MEKESFGDRSTAGIMNESFVSIKVNCEERPDIDSIYMSPIQAMTDRIGWPMTGVPDARWQALLWRHVLPAGGPPRHAGLSQGALDACQCIP